MYGFNATIEYTYMFIYNVWIQHMTYPLPVMCTHDQKSITYSREKLVN